MRRDKVKNTNINYEPENLFVITGQEEEKDDWAGMPEFEQPELEAWKTIKVRFDCEEDLIEFAQKIGQKLTPKTKSIRYPETSKDDGNLLRWIDEDDIDNDDVVEIIE